MKATVTVEVDARGRFTIPEPARRVISIYNKPSKIILDLRVLMPENAKGMSEKTTVEVDDRGRATIKPSEIRKELNIYNQESIIEATISKMGSSS